VVQEAGLTSGEEVEPGETRSWTITLKAPQSSEIQWQAWQMVREDGYVGWFGDLIRFEVHVEKPSSNCGDGTEPGVYLYSDKNFKGDCSYFTSSDGELDDEAVGDNEASSIRLVEE